MKSKITFASIGDLCIDIYAQKKKFFLGGTAFNTAVQAKRAGAEATIFSSLGTDDYGELFLTALQNYNVDSSRIAVVDGETSSLSVTLADDGKRKFSEWRLGVLQKYRLQDSDKKALQKYTIARVTLFKPLKELFETFAALSLPETIKVADFAGASQYSEGLDLLERYSKDFDVLIKSVEDQTDFSYFRQLSLTHTDKLYVILRGERGSIVFVNGVSYEQAAKKIAVTDSNGAGDAYIANFLVTYVETKNVAKAMLSGSEAATKTIREIGAVK